MILKCLYSRCGEPIHHNINGFEYIFKDNGNGDFVCNVLSGEHRSWMIASGNYEAYKPPPQKRSHKKKKAVPK